MRDRKLLSDQLHKICDNVYYQPGENVHLEYPCIVYQFLGPKDRFADNGYYNTFGKYQLTHIYKSPSNRKLDEFRAMDKCNWSTTVITDGLYNDIYVIYF